jgi:low temperature requirement protein LtrA
LFLVGHLLFKRAVFGVWSISRLAVIAILGIIALIGRDWAPLALSVVALLVVAAISWHDLRTHRTSAIAAQWG